MKHNWTVTGMLVLFFLLAQFTGLWLLNTQSSITIDPNTNSTVVGFQDTAIGGRPETTGAQSLIYILIAVAIGTVLVLVIAKFGKTNIWRAWFFLAVWMALCVSLGVFFNQKIFFDYDVAIFLSLVLTFWKIMRPNIYIHNITEVLMYAGIGLIIVPIFDVTWALALLLIISVYDMYAVWKSKHMIKLAKFQSQSNMFAGLTIPYTQDEKGNHFKIHSGTMTSDTQKNIAVQTKPKIRGGKTMPKNAILGGGDIVFPLIFIGAVMNAMILSAYAADPTIALEQIKSAAFLESSIIVITTAISLLLLFIYAEKGKFYPAMPFLTAGCLVGWAITLLI